MGKRTDRLDETNETTEASAESATAMPVPEPAAAKPPTEPTHRTPEEWAVIRGHVDGRDRRHRPSLRLANRWKFLAAKSHAGWGRKVALDVLITGEEYDAAVDAALNVSVR